MRIAQSVVAVLVLLVTAQAQEPGSAGDVRALAAAVERLEQRLAELEGRPTSPAGGRFRILTENKNREGVEGLLKERFSGFTIFEARGHFKGAERWYDEASLVIEITGAGRAQVEAAARAIRELNQQEAVLVEEMPARARLVNEQQPVETAAPPVDAEPATADSVRVLEAQVAEQAQTKVESHSRLPVRIFGTILSGTHWNSGEANWLDLPNLVLPPPGGGLPSGSFSSSLRQSRIGAIIDGPQAGPFKTSAFIAMDFFGGVPDFQTGQVMGLPRLLYGFIRLESERTAIQIGQDNMILAPRNPTSLGALSFPNLYRSGNLYLRVPQVRLERKLATGEHGEWELMGAILAPVAGDKTGPYTFVPPNLAGERSRHPAVQGRVGWRSRTVSAGDRGLAVGVSGHYGRERFAAGPNPSWAVAVDFDARSGSLGVGGEWWVGRNVDAFGGSLGQLAKSWGGFTEARLKATPKLEFNAGLGLDRLFDRAQFAAPLDANWSVFANTIYSFTPEFAASFEYRWLSTRPATGDSRQNSQVDLVLAYSF